VTFGPPEKVYRLQIARISTDYATTASPIHYQTESSGIQLICSRSLCIDNSPLAMECRSTISANEPVLGAEKIPSKKKTDDHNNLSDRACVTTFDVTGRQGSWGPLINANPFDCLFNEMPILCLLHKQIEIRRSQAFAP
jgi:hypothetical protein